jgi:hypothetical protein
MSSGAALLVAWRVLSLLPVLIWHAVVCKPLFPAGLLRLARLMNATEFAAAFIFHFMIAHCARIFIFTLHPGNYLLPVNGMGGP